MVFTDRFTPTDYQNKNSYNEHVLTERYNTARALRESYSHMYQEVTLLRNSLQDYKGEQENHPQLQMSEEDRLRYNNMIQDRYLALKSVQTNTTYPSEYGHTVRPFIENSSKEQIKLHCQYMMHGSRHLKQYHLARTSCIELNEENKNGDELYDYNTNEEYMSNKAVTFEIEDISRATKAILITRSSHMLKKGTKIFIGGINTDSMINVNNQRFVVGEILNKQEFYLEDNDGNIVNSTNFKKFDQLSTGYILPDPDETYTGFNLIKSISKDNEKALLTTIKSHHLTDGDFVKLRGISDQHNELIQSTGVNVKNQTKILENELITFEIETSSEGELQNSFKVGDNLWLSDSNSNLDRSKLHDIGVLKYISTPNSIIFDSPIHHTAAKNNYIFYNDLDNKHSVGQITRCSKSKSKSIHITDVYAIPNNAYLVAKSSNSVTPKIIGYSSYSYLSFSKAYFSCNIGPAETGYITTTMNISGKLIEGSIIYSDTNCTSCVARVVSINGDTRIEGNLKIENLSPYNLYKCPIYLAKVKLSVCLVDCLEKRDQIFVLQSPHHNTLIKNNVNSQSTYISIYSNPKAIPNGSYIFSINPSATVYNSIIFYHGIKNGSACSYKFQVLGSSNFTIPTNAILYKGDNLGTKLNDSTFQIAYNDNKSFYLLDKNKDFVTTGNLGSSYIYKNNIGNGIIENIVKFSHKKFYINKLDAIDDKISYGNGCNTFKFADTEVQDQDVIEGHIYIISKMNNKDYFDGRQIASILARNVQNCENILSILANNCTTCDRSMNRICEIAKMVKVTLELE